MEVQSSVDVEKWLDVPPFKASLALRQALWAVVAVGLAGFVWGLSRDPGLSWGAFHVSLLYWLGVAVAGVVLAAIFQIVRARWSPALRRVAEAGLSFLPWAFIALLCTWFGREYLFFWGAHPMPGREWWMQPVVVYVRFFLLFGALFYLMYRFVRLSLRGDVGLLRDRSRQKHVWRQPCYDRLLRGWSGADSEIPALQRSLSWHAPLLIAVYAVVFSFFGFEMVMGMDPTFYSSLFGGFLFIGNVYFGLAMLALWAVWLSFCSPEYASAVGRQQRWDLGKLTVGFAMLWADFAFCQFLPIWYGNLPHETQWLIIRLRENPWRLWGWATFSLCFIIPFILLLSRDVKKTAFSLAVVSALICLGHFFEKYLIVMPQLSPGEIPLTWWQVLIFLGFGAGYVLSVLSFLGRYPLVPVSHPLASGNADW